MAANDRAIVVGLSRYPSLGDLGGPENDAKDFEKWLLDKGGGDVPQVNITRILSSDFEPKPSALDAEPTTAALEYAFDKLFELGDNNAGKAGRRLYIYLAGHGFAPNLEDAALLMANAARGRTGHHIAGRPYANWFRQSAFFDEVVLFMDCCRDNYKRAPVRLPPYEDNTARVPARYLYAFATEWSRTSRERPIGAGGEVRGLFTVALIAGLRGSAPRENGKLTAKTLADFLYSYVPQLAIDNGVERQDPDVDWYKPDPIVFTSVAPALFQVRVKLGAGDSGKAVELLDGLLQPVAAKKMSPQLWEWEVAPGMYKVVVQGGAHQVVEFVGEGRSVDVTV